MNTKLFNIFKDNFITIYNLIHYYNNDTYFRRAGTYTEDLVWCDWCYERFKLTNADSMVLSLHADDMIQHNDNVYNSISQYNISYSTNTARTSTIVEFNEQLSRRFISNKNGIELGLDIRGLDYEAELFQASTEYGVLEIDEVQEVYNLLIQLPLRKDQKFRIMSPNNWTDDLLNVLCTINKILKVI